MLRHSFAASALALLASGCSLDLSLPEQPQRGKLTGQIDTGGHIPVEANPIILVAEDGSRSSQVTDASGAFIFSDLPPGLYFLEVSLPGFAPLIRPNLRVLAGQTLDAGTLAPTWLQGTSAEALVSGKVVINGTGDPAGGQVEFILEQVSQRVAIAPIGLGGDFVQRVPPGTYKLRAIHPHYVTAELTGLTVGAAETKDLTQSPLVLDINPATVTGTVLEERDGQTAVPAEGALVTLSDGATTTTDPAGHFQLTGLAAGSRSLRITLAGFHDPVESHAIVLEPGKTTAVPAVTLRLDRGTVVGTVELADHQPARDITVALSGTPYSAVVSPDSSQPWKGSFQISSVPVGTYEVSATKARYSRAVAGSVLVSANSATNVGTLTLTLLQGDFVIEDGDATNTSGYTRSPQVTLNLSGFTGAARFRASEDPSFTGVVFQPFTSTNQPFTLSSAQGTHTVYAQYEDANGTPSPLFSASIVLDSVAPANPTVVINGGAAFTRQAQPLAVTLQAEETAPAGVDAVSGLAFVRLSESPTLDGSGNLGAPRQPYQRDLSFVRPSSADGVQPVYAQIIDHAGNVSAVASASIVVDTVNPSGSIALVPGAKATASGYTHTAMVELTQTAGAEPNGGYVLVKLANDAADLASAVLQPVKSASIWFLDPTGEGTKTVYAVFQDAAGNTSGTVSASIVYDTTPPSPATATLVGSSPTKSSTVTLSLTASDSNGLSATQAVTVSEDPFFLAAGTVGPSAFPASSQLSFPLSAGDGPKQVFVRFRDVAGNDATASVMVTLDTQPPTLSSVVVRGTLADGSASTEHTSTPNVTVLVTQSGASEILLGDETLTSCPGSGYSALTTSAIAHSLTGAATPRQVRVCLRDAADNRAGPVTASIALDASAPAGCVLSLTGTKVDGTAAPAGRTGRSNVTASISGCAETPTEISIGTSSLSCTASAALGWQPFASSLPVLLAGPDGLNTLYGCVRDAARNTASVTSASITLDTTPPSAPMVVIDSGAAYVNQAAHAARGGYVASIAGTASGATEWALSETSSFSSFVSYASNPQQFTFGGGGLRTIHAVFRDDVGNLSPVVTDSIEFDIAPPSTASASIALISPTANAYTHSVSVTLRLSAPADATEVLFAEATSSAACAQSDLSAAVPRAVADSYTFLLTSGDGLKRVCAQLLDAAGNPSDILSSTITLDTVPPTGARITTSPRTFNPGGTLTFTVDTDGPVTEAHFARYEIVGGATTSWTTASTSISTTSFDYTLVTSSAASGLPNVLRLRAVDLAGNVGPESSVTVTTDIVAPAGVSLNPRWVSNSVGQSTLYWQPSASPDVSGYRVYYGAATVGASGSLSSYNGQYATQGPSPVATGSTPSVTLSGLPNGAITFLTVRAVDHAGNLGGAPISSTVEVPLQPNVVSPDLIADIPLAMSTTKRLVVYGHLAYAFGTTGGCGGSPVLQPIDLSTLVSAVQGGAIQTSPPGPVALSAQTFADTLDCTSVNGGTDLVLDGDHLFTASGSKIRIFKLAVATAPTLVATIDLSPGTTAVHSLAVRGNYLFAAGRPSNVIALSLTKLYDNNAATVPSAADVVGTATNGNANPAGLALTRDKLVVSGSGTYYFNVADALDGSGATAWDNADRLGTTGVGLSTNFANPPVSGNYLYDFGRFGYQLVDLTNLWSGTSPYTSLLTSSGIASLGQVELLGSQVILNDEAGPGIRSIDLSQADDPVDTGLYLSLGITNAQVTAAYGNYLLVGSITGRFQVYEVATPRSLHSLASTSSGGPRAELAGGFLYNSSGLVHDLGNGLSPPALNTIGTTCNYDGARFDDTVVTALGTSLRIHDLDDVVDRNPATAWSIAADSYDVALPAGVRATGVEAMGNFLVVAEVRTSGTPGIYVEVFDARKLRERPAGTFSLSDSRGSFRVSSYSSAGAWADVSLALGRAAVIVEDGAGNPNPGLFLVDLRPLLDDDAGTTMSASHLQGTVNVGGVRECVIRGRYAYATNSTGFHVVDVMNAMDEDLATVVPGSATLSSVAVTQASSLSVHGSYALVSPYSLAASGVHAIDVSTPASPKVIGFLPFKKANTSCGVPGDGTRPMRTSTIVRGSRAYLTSFGSLDVLELE